MGQSGGPPNMAGFGDNQAQPRNSLSYLLVVAPVPAQGSTQAHLGSYNRLRPSSFVPWPLDVPTTMQASFQPNDILATPLGPVYVCPSCQSGVLLPCQPVDPAWNGALPAQHFQPNDNFLGPLEPPTGPLEPLQPWPEAPEYGGSVMVDQLGLGPDGSTDGPVSAGLVLLADTAVAQPRAEPMQAGLGTGTGARPGQRGPASYASAGGGAARNRNSEAARNVARTQRLERLARMRLNAAAAARADFLAATRGYPGDLNQDPSGPGFGPGF